MSGNPFPGPRPYTANDRALFFARDAVIKKLVNQIRARPATTLFGPSGAGKSSLMQAGVIPLLEESKRTRVVRVDAWPPKEPALPWLVSQLHIDFELGDVPPDMKSLDAFQQAMDLAWRQSDRPLMIYLDQLEQLFLGERDGAEVEALCAALSWLVDAERSEDVRVVLSLREDYLGRLRDATRDRAELSAYGFRVAPLSVGEIVPAMCRTAREGNPGQTWDERDIRLLMLDVRVPGLRATDAAEVQTAFGQIVCRALWDERSAGRDVRGADAEAILRRYLDATLADLGPLQGLAEQLLEEHLVDDEGHRRILTEKEARLVLGGSGGAILDRLDAARVLRAEEHQGSRYFELGHDWLAKKVLERRVARKKSEAEVKRRQEESRRQADARRVRRRSMTIVVFAVFVALAMSSFGAATWGLRALAISHNEAATKAQKAAEEKAREAMQATRMAGARELLARNEAGLAGLVLGSIDKPEQVRGWAELARDILVTPSARSTWRHEGWVNDAAFSPDGKFVVSVSEYKTARVWRSDGTGDPLVLKGHEDETVSSAQFSLDSKRIVTSSIDKTVRVWRVDGAGEAVVLKGHEGRVNSAAFSPDGKFVVSASDDKTARVWRADGTGEPVVLKGHESAVYSASFRPDGQFVVTGSLDMARVWRSDGAGEPVVLKGHEAPVMSAAFSPDGRFVVTASLDKTARVWRADGTGDPVLLKGHENLVPSAAFSPDGKFVVTASDDRTARVWRADGKAEPVVLKGHVAEVRSAAFSPDGLFVVTASQDQTARVWRTDGSGEPAVLGHQGLVTSASFSPDGQFVVTASDDNTVRIWPAGIEPIEIEAISIPRIQDALRNKTTDCLTPAQRETYLLETPTEARTHYEECSRSYGRTP